MPIRATSAALAAVAAVAVFALAGCSSGGSGDSAASDKAEASSTSGQPATATDAGSDKDALTAAVRAYSAAYFKPDPTAAAALLSTRCQRQTSIDAYRTALKEAVATYGHQEIKTVTVDQLSGETALVSYTYSVPVLTQKGQPWIREQGAWHYDDC